jgi:2-desacetyl-2-hydroxyethyl bacteriochlorophyllide A dehydrogenase
MSRDNARAFWITGPGTGELRHADLAEPGPGEVEVETLYTAISRGTETLVFSGSVPSEETARMRAPFQEGDFPAPVKYGYINVGRVTRGVEELVDRDVFCLYPHQTRFVVPADAVTLIPDDVPAARAVLAANLETAVNGIWDGAPRVGDRIAVVGAGVVGCLLAWLAAGQRGTEVELIDIDPRKGEAARALDVPFRSPEQAAADFDLVFHASGTADGLNLALELAGFEAKIVELSWFGAKPVSVSLGGPFHSKRLRLVSSQVGQVATGQRSRWDHARRMRLVMRLLASDVLDALISGESSFDELPDVMRGLASDRGGTLCHRITYR